MREQKIYYVYIIKAIYIYITLMASRLTRDVSFESIFARDTGRPPPSTPYSKNYGTELGIALRSRRLFNSVRVGRSWRRSLRAAPLFFWRGLLVNIQRDREYLPRLFRLPSFRNTIYFFHHMQNYANAIPWKLLLPGFFLAENIKDCEESNAGNSMRPTLKLAQKYIVVRIIYSIITCALREREREKENTYRIVEVS